ncbi:MAG: peptidase, partial [Armatimonadota bacterium]
IFPNGAGVRGNRAGGGANAPANNLADDMTIPFRYRLRMGSMSTETVSRIEKFVRDGGHIFCIGSAATSFAQQMKLPVKSAIVDDKGVALTNTKFYIPGSVLQLKLENSRLTRGMDGTVDVMFDNSPAFKVSGDAKAVGTFDSDKPLRSGWAWGQEVLKGSAGVIDVSLGKGQVVLVGPEILFRGQNHGAYKLLMNAILRSSGG